MRRVGYIIEEIVEPSNMEASFRQVLRGSKRKRSRQGCYLLAHKPEVLEELVAQIASGTFRVKDYREREIIEGGNCDDSVGYFVDPTVILAKHDKTRTMVEEIFGPVLTIYVYPDDKLEEIMRSCDKSTGYALTGAIYANDRLAIMEMEKALTNAAGNFYINDKPTGAVVGQQPFGGGRGSGTNDKAGSAVNLYRWVSQRVIKESFVPDKVVLYPHMEE